MFGELGLEAVSSLESGHGGGEEVADKTRGASFIGDRMTVVRKDVTLPTKSVQDRSLKKYLRSKDKDVAPQNVSCDLVVLAVVVLQVVVVSGAGLGRFRLFTCQGQAGGSERRRALSTQRGRTRERARERDREREREAWLQSIMGNGLSTCTSSVRGLFIFSSLLVSASNNITVLHSCLPPCLSSLSLSLSLSHALIPRRTPPTISPSYRIPNNKLALQPPCKHPPLSPPTTTCCSPLYACDGCCPPRIGSRSLPYTRLARNGPRPSLACLAPRRSHFLALSPSTSPLLAVLHHLLLTSQDAVWNHTATQQSMLRCARIWPALHPQPN